MSNESKKIPYIDSRGVYLVNPDCLYNREQIFKDIIEENVNLKTNYIKHEEQMEMLEAKLYKTTIGATFVIVTLIVLLLVG